MAFSTSIVRFLALSSTFAALTAGQAVSWSRSSLADNVTVPACPGQDVTLHWDYSLQDPTAVILNTEWRFQPEVGPESVMATAVMGNFFGSPEVSSDIEYIPPAGIRLLDVAEGDSGTYTVRVNLNVHGAVITETRTARVEVSTKAVTESGALDVRMEPNTVLLPSDGQMHVVLSCGTFRPVWRDRVDVVWRTSSDQAVNSTWEEAGRYYVALANPVSGSEEYTCTVDPASPAVLCVQPGSAAARGATVLVEEQKARFTLMEGQLQALANSNSQLQHRLDTVMAENANLTQRVDDLTTQAANLTSELTVMASAPETPLVAFQAHPRTSGHPLYDVVDSNTGQAYDPATGVFTAPVSGLYAFFITANAADSEEPVQVDLLVSNHVVSVASALYQTTGSNRALVALTAGDRAEVRVTRGDLEGGRFSTFSGVLLHGS